jgi:5-methylcytosine-specific restriction protein A
MNYPRNKNPWPTQRTPRPCLSCGKATTERGSRCKPCKTVAQRDRNKRKSAKRQAKMQGAQSAMRREINRVGGTHCAVCLNWYIAPFLQVDHTKPLADGGTDTPDNVQPLCTPCHKAKTAREATARASQ